jgi:hypothetical protein
MFHAKHPILYAVLSFTRSVENGTKCYFAG